MNILITVAFFGLFFLAMSPFMARSGRRVAKEWEASGGKYRTGFWMGFWLTGPTTRFIQGLRDRRQAKSDHQHLPT